MIKLAHVFADNALYLQNSLLTLRGECTPKSEIKLSLIKESTDEKILSACATSEENGKFSISFTTPEASFDKYTISLSSSEDAISIKGILFGELWIASGQSNMELPNSWCNEWEEMRESIKDLPIRVYNINNLPSNYNFSREPLEDYIGQWADEEHYGIWDNVSASATAFVKELYLYFLKNGKQIPVGFVNSNRGGSNIECWIPESDALKNRAVVKHLKSVNLYPTDENYNTFGSGNYNQVGCHYNFKIHPTVGVKYRGVLWYQGESNIGSHNNFGAYSDLLKQVRDSLKDRFAPESDSPFPLIASHLYPWAFNSCSMGYLNTSITYLAKKYPKNYSFVPVCDMKSGWSFQTNNHPIHPTHKYEHGVRTAHLAENMLYGRGGRSAQKAPAILKKWWVDGNRIILEFLNTGTGIYIKDKEARGLYIRSENSVYTKAYAEVIGRNMIAVSHPYIDKPIHACYGMSSFEHYINLFAGEFPIGPFSTEADMKCGTPKIDVKVKNWLNLELDGEISIQEADRNVFPRAIYHPSEKSELCYDSDYSLSSRSLRVRGEESGFGCYVLSHKLREFDLENYKQLRLSVLNSKALELFVRLYYPKNTVTAEGESIESIIHKQGSISENADKKAVDSKFEAKAVKIDECDVIYEIKADKLAEYRTGWGDFSVNFENIPSGQISKMEFFFRIGEENHLRTTVAIDKLILVPKQ